MSAHSDKKEEIVNGVESESVNDMMCDDVDESLDDVEECADGHLCAQRYQESKVPEFDQEKFCCLLAKMMVCDALPFSLLDLVFFHTFLKTLDPPPNIKSNRSTDRVMCDFEDSAQDGL